jgi:hypothetical protein
MKGTDLVLKLIIVRVVGDALPPFLGLELVS